MSKLRKTIAILLTVLTLMSVISAATPVWATEVTELTESENEITEETEKVAEQTTSEEPEILNEMVEWRAESTKYFRNSDGSYTAAQYAYPVHYKKNGEWKEIDNTLTEKTISDTDKEFVAENTNTPAIFPEELNQDSNNEISVTSGNHTIRFSPKKNQKGFKVSDGKIKDREELDSVKIVESSKEKHKFSTFKLSKKTDIKDNKQNEKFKVENKSGAIVYEEVFKNVDFEYELNNSKLKESIILNRKLASYVFSFDMDLDGLHPIICEDGSINLCSDKEGKKTVAKIEAPYMVDSNGEYSDAVTMSIKESGEEYILTVTADEEWLNDDNRAYPVVIDPTIKLEVGAEKTYDCYVDDSDPGTAQPYDDWLYVGNNSYGKTRTFVKFDLPSLPDDNCIITNAAIVYYQYEIDHGSGSTEYITIHKVTEDWDNADYNVTWNNQPDFEFDKVLDYAEFDDSDDDNLYPYKFDITRTVKEWYEGAGNYGLAIKLKDETATKRSRLVSAEHPVDGFYPEIYVTFRNNKGLEGYWDYSSFGVGAVGTAHVNDYTGNLVYELPVASSISEIMPVSIVGYYNNYCANELIRETEAENVRTSIGRGFRLSYQQTVLPSSKYGLTGNNAETYPYVYTDGDGTEHYIQKVVENEGKDNEKIIYKDEDGLGLTFTTTLDEGERGTYKITDKAHNKYFFNEKGNLFKIVDKDNNEITIEYKEASSADDLSAKSRIDKIIDGAGHTYKFTYNVKESNDVEMDYVSRITDDAGREHRFYVSSGLLQKVTYPDGNEATFDYNISSGDSSEGRINAVYSNGIYELNFDYTSKGTGRRVKTVKEYGESTKGQVITFDRSRYNTTIMRSCGLDCIHSNDDDIITTIQYDNMGRSVSQQMKFGSGDEIGAGSCSYTTSDSDDTASGFKNKVSGGGATGKFVENLLYGGNGEDLSDWTFYDKGSVVAEPDLSTASRYIGKKSLKLTVTDVVNKNDRCYFRQSVTDIKPGNKYTLSAYVKTGDLNPIYNTSSTGAYIEVIAYNSDGDAIAGADSRSQTLTERTSLDVNKGWRRLSATIDVPSNASYLRCFLSMRNIEGSTCFDGIQLEKGETANDYNMLENAHFTDLSRGNEPTSWEGTSKFVFETGKNGVIEPSALPDEAYYDDIKSKTFKITGEPNVEKGVTQTVTVEGNSDDTYILSGWAKGFPINSTYHTSGTGKNQKEIATFEIAVKVNYTASDGSDPSQFKTPASFNTTITDWQCASVPISLKYTGGEDGVTYTPKSIKIIPRYHNQENFVFFDKIMLVKDVASSYTYDKEGNLISAASNGEQKANMKYNDDDNLISYTDTAGFKTELTYENNKSVNYVKSANGVYTNYDYDSYGNVISTEVRNKGKIAEATAVLKTTSDYYETTTKDSVTINAGAYKTADYDQNGNATTYIRDHKTGTPISVTDAKNVVTNYEYYPTNNDKPFGKQKSVSVGGSKVTYDYNTNKQLSKIIFGNTKKEQYSFVYDGFGNVKQTLVGSQSLSTNTFKANNGPLAKTTYGNGDVKRFTYNNFGQKAAVYGTDANSDSTAEKLLYSWTYNDSGVGLTHTDHVNQLEYIGDYDSLGRLSKEETQNSETNAFIGSTEYGYDIRNNLTSLITNYGGKGNKQQYFYTQVSESANSADYQKDNLPTMYKLNDDIYALYRYGTLNRYNQRNLVIGTNTNLYYNYIYKVSDRNASGESKYRTTQIAEEYIGNDVYLYGYDVLGNITSIKKAERTTAGSNETSHTTAQDYVTYSYDDLGQLTEEKFLNKETRKTWLYDELGNITNRNEYKYVTVTDPETNTETEKEIVGKSVVYTYTTDNKSTVGWNNLLTSVKTVEYEDDETEKSSVTETITYDQIGNPTSYLGASLKWNGRELTSYTEGDTSISYKYDADGLRTSKTVNGVTSKYFYVNGQLHYEERSDGTKLYFFYDSNGFLTGLEYNNTMYYPATNKRGDVVAIYNNAGVCVVGYEYDAWGNIISVTDGNDIEISDQSNIAHINPIRYRGYYYDTETKFYYLQSRYYNPEVGRFLNADGYLTTGQGVLSYNMFAYCGNNPGMLSDPSGHFSVLALVGVVIATLAVTAFDHYVHKKHPDGVSLTPELYNKKETANYTIENETTYAKGSGPSLDNNGFTLFDTEAGLYKDTTTFKDGGQFSFIKIATAEATCEVDLSGTPSAELGGYAALYSIDGSTTLDLGAATLEISGAMYFGSVSGGAELDLMEWSGSITSPSVGAGYKIGWDIDWK